AEWSWRVDALQSSADIRVRELEDVAASLFFVFGDIGPRFAPQQAPTLRYVWTNATVSAGQVVDNPYLSGVVRSIVVRSGAADSGRFVRERRDLIADFKRAFGREPSDRLRTIILFTDNDQTGEPVVAAYEWARLNCEGGRGRSE